MALFDAIVGIPFWTRAVVTVCALSIVGAAELALRRERARRWKEYAAWIVFAALGAFFGAANDLITSSLSPAYFTIGKGLPPGPHFVWAAVDLGARAGAAAGLLAGGILLMANNPWKAIAPLPYRQLAAAALALPITAAIGALLFALGSTRDVQGLGPELAKALSASDVHAFLLVQRAHVGAYVGTAIGTVGGVLQIRRMRRSRAVREYSARASTSAQRSASAGQC